MDRRPRRRLSAGPLAGLLLVLAPALVAMLFALPQCAGWGLAPPDVAPSPAPSPEAQIADLLARLERLDAARREHAAAPEAPASSTSSEWINLGIAGLGMLASILGARQLAAGRAAAAIGPAIAEHDKARGSSRERVLEDVGAGLLAAIEASRKGASAAELAAIITERLPGVARVTPEAAEAALREGLEAAKSAPTGAAP